MKGIEGLTLGRYELRRRVAQGGMAEVYLAYDRRVRRQVAIKVLYGRDESFIRRFEREALAVGALSHDHILPLYDFGEQRPWYYLVMPYVEGGTLRDYLFRRTRLTLEEAASFLDQIASALQYAHEHGVVHRAVKPSNILLRPDGYAYLVDFGLAKTILGGEALTNEGAMIGTPEYMAPEQSNGINDYRSDIYSLGVILYQMLTGRVPFTAESPVAVSLKHIQSIPIPPRELNEEIPLSIEEIILKAMAKDPQERYQKAQECAIAYWKALQTKKNKLGARETQTLSLQDIAAEKEVIEVVETVSPEIPRVLPEVEQTLLYPPPTPLLFPLIEPSEQPESLSDSNSQTKKRHIRRFRRLRPLLIILACLIVIASIIPLSFPWSGQGGQIVQRATTTPKTLADRQYSNELTATAIAQATLQATLAAQARVQATAITSSIGAGNVLYSDALTTPGGGWIDDGRQCFFSPEGYHVRSFLRYGAAWCYTNQIEVSDAIITAQAQLLHGDTCGIVFRLSPNSKTFYILEINNLGEYRFVRAPGNNPANWLTLIDWTHSNAILSGYGHLNTFLILATGSHFRFYINKQLIVTSFTDIAYVSGLIGFFVGGDHTGGTEAVFSNIWVFQKQT